MSGGKYTCSKRSKAEESRIVAAFRLSLLSSISP